MEITNRVRDILCDERDVGTGIPIALDWLLAHDAKLHGWTIGSLSRAGVTDVEWLVWAGNAGMLVLSCNKKMLLVPTERQAIMGFQGWHSILDHGRRKTCKGSTYSTQSMG